MEIFQQECDIATEEELNYLHLNRHVIFFLLFIVFNNEGMFLLQDLLFGIIFFNSERVIFGSNISLVIARKIEVASCDIIC